MKIIRTTETQKIVKLIHRGVVAMGVSEEYDMVDITGPEDTEPRFIQGSKRVITIPSRRDIQFARRLTDINTELGLGSVDELWEEISGYIDVLLGREESPIDSPYLAMMEVATAYFARAQEIDALIHRGEREGSIMKGSQLYRFRTGELRSFLELSKRCAELGSRRLTQEALLADARRDEEPMT